MSLSPYLLPSKLIQCHAGHMAYTFNPRFREGGTGGLVVQDHPLLYKELEAILSFISKEKYVPDR